MIEKELIEKEKFKEEKIIVKTDYASIVKRIRIDRQAFGKYVSFYVIAELEGSVEIKSRIDENLLRYIKTCQAMDLQPFISRLLVKELNEEKQKTYTCFKLISNKGNVYRYFINRADEETLEMVYNKFLQINKK